MTRDAEVRPGDYLELVMKGVGQETRVNTVQSLLRLARQAAEPYGDPDLAESRRTIVADRSFELMRTSEAGGDLQLAFARAGAANATTDEQLDLVAGLLDGSQVVDGLAIDTELRWALLHRLVVMGRAGDAEIDAELAKDLTAAGRRHSLTLQASRPTAEAKAEAWRLVVDDELPNADQAAVLAGFQQQEQRDLIRPYVEKYFEIVGDLYQTRTLEMAQQVAIGLYPTVVAEQATVDRTDEYLRTAQPGPALRRLLLESRDGLARALRAQQRDREATSS
jgi:aminopeptidase N